MSISIHITARYEFALCQVHNKCPDSLPILITLFEQPRDSDSVFLPQSMKYN